MKLNSFLKPNVSGKGVAWNTIVKIVTIAFTIVIDLYYTKFLLEKLGESSYGLIALTTNTIQIASIITYVIFSSMGRFASIEVHGGDTKTANQVFNVAFYSLVVVSIFFLLPVFIGVSWFSPNLFVVPAGMENASRFLFGSVLLSFLIISMGSVLSIGTFIYNRLDLVDILNFTKIIVSRGLAMLLISFAGLGLYSIGVGLLLAAILNIVCSVFLLKTFTRYISISRKFWNKEIFNKMGVFSLWIFIRQLGGRALVYLDLIVVNQLYGAAETGLYGIAYFFSSKLKLMTGTFAGLFNPIILSRYAKGDTDGMLDIACRGMRVIGLAFALPVGLLCGLYKPIFNVWVGTEYENLSLLAVCLTIHVSINTTTYLLSSILAAVDRVKVPAIVSIISAVSNVLLAVWLGHPAFGLGTIGIAIAGFVSLTINNAIFTPIYVGHVLKRSSIKIFMTFIPGIIGVLVSMLIAYLFSCISLTYSWTGLIIVGLFLFTICGLVFWFFLFNKEDRAWIVSIVSSKLKSGQNG